MVGNGKKITIYNAGKYCKVNILVIHLVVFMIWIFVTVTVAESSSI